MTNIELKVNGASAKANASGLLTSGMIGVTVSIEYDSSWENLKKTAFFRAGNITRKRDNVEYSTTIPWEVMRNHGKTLQIGIEGRNQAGDLVIPTVWASAGKILQGANADIPAAPNPESGETPNVSGAQIDDSVVAYDKTWSSQKIYQELENAGGGSAEGAVLYTEQTLTDAQKAQARDNIGAVEASGEWECIQKICFGYEMLTEKPDDWDTNKTSYFYASTSNSKMISVDSWRNFTPNFFWRYTGEFDPEVTNITLTEEPDGTPYNFKYLFVGGHIYNPTETDGLWCFTATMGGSKDANKEVRAVASLPKNVKSNPYHFAYKLTRECGVYSLICFSGPQGNFTAATGVSNAATAMIMKPVTDGNITKVSVNIYSAKQYYSEGDYIEIWGVR